MNKHKHTLKHTILKTAALLLLAVLLAFSGACKKGGTKAEVLWDTWGVPHIYSDDTEALFYAFGWCQMHSHGDLILQLFGQARGRAAEYWGKTFLESDGYLRTMGIYERAQSWYEKQKPVFKGYLDAFVRGMNDYAAGHPELLSAEMMPVLPVTGSDVLAHLQRVIHVTFIGGNAFPSTRRWFQKGSNAWAVAPSHTNEGKSLLLINPHLPWNGFFTWYEAQLVSPELKAYGAALVGLPFLGVGFNDNLGWTHTVNTMDGMDLYELTLKENGYMLDGELKTFDVENSIIKVRLESGQTADHTLTVLKSAHGPVIAKKKDKALAVRLVGLDRPFVFEQYWNMLRASNLAEFEAALKPLQMPFFNIIYADRDGHIMYLYNGLVPKRSEGDWDFWQGIIPGDRSELIWTNTHPYEDLPRIVDPENGWVQNANDPPWSAVYPPVLKPEDFPPYLSPHSLSFRAQRSIRMLMEDDSISFDELVAYKHSSRMELADRIVTELIETARKYGGDKAKEAADIFETWDRMAGIESRGAVLFSVWYFEAGSGIFAQPWSENDPLGTPSGLADPKAAVAALEKAVDTVKHQYGQIDVTWGNVYRLRIKNKDLPASGGPSHLGIFRVLGFTPDEDGFLRAVTGDSFVAVVQFGETVRAQALLSYGNSSQKHSPHHGDQLDLLSRDELRPVWLEKEAVEQNLEAQDTLILKKEKK
ncbi:MAG: acylase [Candidatus Aminicenantes bacterium]|nr:acylase [Candidatus Aminicenantes bacterium]